MPRRPIELVAVAASLLACFAIAACGGNDDAIKSSTTAEQVIRNVQLQRCQKKISNVHCEAHGDDYNCTWDTKKGSGKASLPKSGTGSPSIAC